MNEQSKIKKRYKITILMYNKIIEVQTFKCTSTKRLKIMNAHDRQLSS